MGLREIIFIGTFVSAVVVLAKPQEAKHQKLSSAQIESVLKAGPHAVIRAFEVEPAYRDKTFVGFPRTLSLLSPHKSRTLIFSYQRMACALKRRASSWGHGRNLRR